MTPRFEPHIEDVQQAIESGRAVRDHGPYGILVGNEKLEYVNAVVNDPVPTGRQILEAAGARPALEFSVFQIFGQGGTKELGLDDTVDLRTAGVERFAIFRSDRSYRLELDSRVMEWGTNLISGHALKVLAGVDSEAFQVWLDTRGASDREIPDEEQFDLSKTGVEKFYTLARSVTIIINAREYQVRETELTFLGVIKLPYPDAVISETRIYTVTYKRGPASNPQGTLVEGGSVKIKNGMAFNVLFSDKS